MAKRLTPKQKARAVARAAETKQLRKQLAELKRKGFPIRADIRKVKPNSYWRGIIRDNPKDDLTIWGKIAKAFKAALGIKTKEELHEIHPRLSMRGGKIIGRHAKGETLQLTKKGQVIIKKKINGKMTKSEAVPTNGDFKEYQKRGYRFIVNLGSVKNPRPQGYDDADIMFHEMNKYNRTGSHDWRSLVQAIKA